MDKPGEEYSLFRTQPALWAALIFLKYWRNRSQKNQVWRWLNEGERETVRRLME